MKKVLVGATALVLTTSAVAGPVTPESGKDLSTDIMSVGWAKNKAIGLEYNTITQDNKTNGTKTGESELSYFKPFATWSNESFSAELLFSPTTTESKPISDPSTKTETNTYDLKGAYRFHPNFSFLLGYNNESSKESSSGTATETKTSFFDFGLSYKSEKNFYAAASYAMNNKERSQTTDKADVDYSTYKAAVGYEGSDSLGEYSINLDYSKTGKKNKTVNDLVTAVQDASVITLGGNHVFGKVDIDLSFSLTNQDGLDDDGNDIETDSKEVVADFEYSFNDNVYLTPGITITSGEANNKTASEKSDLDNSEYRLALGYATDKWEATGTIYEAKDKTKLAGSTTEAKGTGFIVNFGYFY